MTDPVQTFPDAAGDPAAATMMAADEPAGGYDEVTIRLPARSIYVAVVRTAIAGVAARCDFTVDEIEDLRIAVDEACALLLHDAAPGADLSCHFRAGSDSLVAAVSARVTSPRMPDPTSFAWLVLTSLAGDVRAEIDGDVLTIVLRRPRAAAAP